MTHLGIALLWLLHRLLPTRVLTYLGETLGQLLYYLPTARRRIGETNLRLCFPAESELWRTNLLKAHFRAMGRSLVHEAIAWWGSREQIEALIRVEGLEHFEAQRGRPLLLLSMHFVGLSIGGIRLSTLHDQCIDIYAPIRNPAIHRIAMPARARFGHTLFVPRSAGIKPVLRALRQGRPLYYFPDLDYGRKDAIFTPFFGVPAATVTGLPRLAKAVGAAVVPLTTCWQGDHYVLRFHPAWTDFPSDDIEADIQRQNAFIEARILETPEQYFWLHKRFKTRPEGEASVYG